MRESGRKFDAIFKTDLVTVGIQLSERGLARVEYLARYRQVAPSSTAAAKVQNKIERLIQGETDDRMIDLDLSSGVSPFQKKVLQQLMKIPRGETRSYGEIARKLKTSPRAVGNACRNNPISIIIPCHRVVSASGIGGYSGKTQGARLDIKRQLLLREGVDPAALGQG